MAQQHSWVPYRAEVDSWAGCWSYTYWQCSECGRYHNLSNWPGTDPPAEGCIGDLDRRNRHGLTLREARRRDRKGYYR